MFSVTSYAQCPDGLQVNVTNKVVNGDGTCTVTFDVSVPNDFATGTKEIALFFYQDGTAPTIPAGSWPTCTQIGSPAAATSINVQNLALNTSFVGIGGTCNISTFQDGGDAVLALNTQTNTWIISGLEAIVNTGCTDPSLSLDVLVLSRTAQSVNGGSKCAVVLPVALPVTYGALKATITNNKLIVDWETLIETNNAKFEVLASKDGYNWKKIYTVPSKSSNGFSENKLSYQVTLDLPLGLAAAGIALLLFVPVFKSRLMRFGFIALAIISIAIACNKIAKENIDLTKEGTVYIKLAQYDKDGNPAKYSKITRVVNE